MKLDRLWIEKFKNIRDVHIEFDESNLITVLVGWNGAGKSNVIEALVIIFRDLDLGIPPKFGFELVYQIQSSTVIVRGLPSETGSPASQYEIKISKSSGRAKREIVVGLNKFKRSGGGEYLPSHVFAYYSGPSRRLEEHFNIHQKNFRDSLLYRKQEVSEPLRPLFYARPVHSQFVLLSFFLGEDDAGRKFISRHLGILGLDSVLFVLRQPYWAQSGKRMPSGGDPRFWGARGVVRDFMSFLYSAALGPHRVKRRVEVGLGIAKSKEFLYLFLKDLDALRNMAEGLSPTLFFKMLESTYLSDVIEEVRIRVRVRGVDGGLTFRELSEGEQQLLVVLGLLRFTGEADSLFLLDEPDTHLNPSWAVKYLSFLRDFVPTEKSSHVILATHNPLAIAELSKEQVQIMWRSSETLKVQASPPAFDPRGMGFAGVLMSDMFGMESTLDYSTQQLIRARRQLAEKGSLSVADRKKLAQVNSAIARSGFDYVSGDRDYSEFLRLRAEIEGEEARGKGDSSTPKQIAARRQRARLIVRQLIAKKRKRK